MIQSPFPDFVGFAVKSNDSLGEFTLSSQEAALISPGAIKKRRDEFILGRAACHSALKQIGFLTPPPVLKGNKNEPLWPDGYIGSLTHSSGIAVCAVCSRHNSTGIGVDIEEIFSDVDQGVFDLVCGVSERSWVEQNPDDKILRFKQIFSAKEAAFKAFFPTAGQLLDFKDSSLVWAEREKCFIGKLNLQITGLYPVGYKFSVGSLISGRIVFSYILLPPKTLAEEI